ncbi:hypothetical protein [Micromonospora zingiberis]|uniref:hypothetical protein n=1 Tax=Micromonospora zingiberis TaxID=2053011 RepID=UPI001F1017C2|nr:hypothetical protein [Micromonospora zingiberis]
MIYLDTAAVVKLVRQEAYSSDLVSWLNDHDDAPLAAAFAEPTLRSLTWRTGIRNPARR